MEDTVMRQKEQQEFIEEIKENKDESKALTLLDDILELIGLGKYQYILYAIILVTPIFDGAEIINIGLTNYVFQKVVWFLNDSQISMIGVVLLVSSMLGNLLSMFSTEKINRRVAFLVGVGVSLTANMVSRFATNYVFYLIVRSIDIISYGFAAPFGYSFLVESTPKKIRGRLTILVLSSGYTFSALISTILAYILNIGEKGSEHWRNVVNWTFYPGIACFILGLIYLLETPRSLLRKNTEEGVKTLEKIHKINKKLELKIQEDEKLVLMALKNPKTDGTSNCGTLFNKENRRITIFLTILWFCSSFVYLGVPYMIPIISQTTPTQELNYAALIASTVSEIPAIIIALFIIEHPTLGRKNSIIIMSFLMAMISLGVYFFEDYYVSLIFFMKFFFCIYSAILTPYTAELFHTNCRVQGIGYTAVISKFGAIAVPLFLLNIFNVQTTVVFLVFAALGFLCTIACCLIPKDTVGMPLDEKHEKI